MLAEGLLLLVVHDELPVALAVQNELLLFGVLGENFFLSPLTLEHFTLLYLLDLCLFLFNKFSFLLPLKHGKSVSNGLLLLSSFSNLTLKLLLSVECVKLRVDILLEHLLFNFATLVNKLLLALNLSSMSVEFGVLLSQGIVLHFELLVVAALHLFLALLLVLALELLETSVHLASNLLRGLQVVIKFLLVHFVFGGEEGGKLGAALLQIGSELGAHLVHTVVDDVLHDDLVCFVFPVSTVSDIAVTRQFIVQFLQVEFLFSASVNSCIGFEFL